MHMFIMHIRGIIIAVQVSFMTFARSFRFTDLKYNSVI